MQLNGTVSRSWDPSDAEGEMFFCSWVPEDRIPLNHRRYVRRVVDRLAKENGFRNVRLRWFGPPINGGDFWGIARGPDEVPLGLAPADQPMTIALAYDLRGDLIPYIVAHEIRHLVQRPLYIPTTQEREVDADRYAAETVLRRAG